MNFFHATHNGVLPRGAVDNQIYWKISDAVDGCLEKLSYIERRRPPDHPRVGHEETPVFAINARFIAGWTDEDAMGLLKKMAKRVESRNFSTGVLKLTGYRLKYQVKWLNSQARARKQYREKEKVEP